MKNKLDQSQDLAGVSSEALRAADETSDGQPCVKCGHSDGVDRGGQCVHRLTVNPSSVAVWDDTHCGCKCSFAVSRLRTDLVPQWQPISTAPKAVAVLLASEKCEIVETGYAECIDTLCTEGHKPTRWMPLPDPPKANVTARDAETTTVS